MKRRSKQEWLALIQRFEEAGVSRASFCRKHNLKPNYFSQRRSELRKQLTAGKQQSGFVQAQVTSNAINHQKITLHVGAVRMEFDGTTPPSLLVDLAKRLA